MTDKQKLEEALNPSFVVELPPNTKSVKYNCSMAMMPMSDWEKIEAAITPCEGEGRDMPDVIYAQSGNNKIPLKNGTWSIREQRTTNAGTMYPIKSHRTKYLRDRGGDTSDGHHTFNELYEHRHALFLAVCKAYQSRAWKSKFHSDGSMFDGWFIAGLATTTGQATYHLPLQLWDAFDVKELPTSPPWDGHTPADVIARIATLSYTTPSVLQTIVERLEGEKRSITGNNPIRNIEYNDALDRAIAIVKEVGGV